MPDIFAIREFLHYDPDSGIFTWTKHHFSNLVGKRAGRIAKSGYRQISINDKLYYEHRLAFLYMTGRWPENSDHKDLNRANNKWENLREANYTQNNQNIAVRKNNKLGLKGVSLIAKNGKYKAQIRINKIVKVIGVYDTPEEAALAYSNKAKEVHGEFYNTSGE